MGETPRKWKTGIPGLISICAALAGCGKLFIENPLPLAPAPYAVVDDQDDEDEITCTLSTAWQTVDDFQSASTQHASAQAIASDSSGALYVVGKAQVSGSNRWTVRKSTDSGSSWTTVDSFEYASGAPAIANGITVSSSGALYVTGYAQDSGGNSHWLVRRSQDGGGTWTTIDDFQHVAFNAYATQATIDSAGAIYVSGYGVDVDNLWRWLLRKSSDQGATWSTLVSHQPSSGSTNACSSALSGSTVGQGFTSLGSASLLLHGCAQTGAASRWLIRTGAIDGTAWTDADDYQLSVGQSASASGSARTGDGAIFVGGYGSDGSSTHWIVRSSQDSAANWATRDQFQHTSGRNSAARALGTDHSSRRIFAAGYGYDSSNRGHWIVRASEDNGASWSVSDDFQYPAIGTSEALGFGRDRSGNLFTLGYGTDLGGIKHWLVRKLSCL